MIYKIFRPEEWAAFVTDGQFTGSPHDRRDGFIHMCAGKQLAGTLAKHYGSVNRITLAWFECDNVEDLKWEVSRGGEKFPHIYNALPHASLDGHRQLVQNSEGIFELPMDIVKP